MNNHETLMQIKGMAHQHHEVNLNFLVDEIQDILINAISVPKDDEDFLLIKTNRITLMYKIFNDKTRKKIRDLIDSLVKEEYIEPLVFLFQEIMNNKGVKDE